ncbi:hypothetical protein ACIQWI_02565 [Peribacillus frigoritolerans]
MGGVGFLGTPAGVCSFAVATYTTWKELYHGSLSFRNNIKKSDLKAYKFKSKTVTMKKINYKGKTTTKYKYHN